MDIAIVNTPFEKDLYGFSGHFVNGEQAATGFRLMDRMWKTVKENKLKNKGGNIWVYEAGNKLFTGVELDGAPGNYGLEHKKVSVPKYAYYRHIGPYSQLGDVYLRFIEELKQRGIKFFTPYLEIYGHYSADESKCESEVLIAVE